MKPEQTVRKILLLLSILFFLFSFAMILERVTMPLRNPRWYVDIEHKKTHVIDFFQFYQVGQLALSPLSRQVYNPDVQKEWTDQLVAPLSNDKYFYNQQMPFAYVLLIPLAQFPNHVAYSLWCVLQTVFGLLGLWYLSRFSPLKPRDRYLFLLGVLASFPAYICLWHGNTTFFLVGFLAFYIGLTYSRKDILAGIMLAFSTYKPQYAFAMAIPALGMQRWKIIAAAAVTEALLLILASFVIGPANVIGYPRIVANAESNPIFFGVYPETMISIRGLFAQFLSIKGSLQASAGFMFLGLIPLYFLWRKVFNNSNVDLLRQAWAVTVVYAVFASPHAHIFDALLISIAAVLTLPTLSFMELRSMSAVQKTWCAMLFLLPITWWMANYAFGFRNVPIVFFFPYITILLLISLALLNDPPKLPLFRSGKPRLAESGDESLSGFGED